MTSALLGKLLGTFLGAFIGIYLAHRYPRPRPPLGELPPKPTPEDVAVPDDECRGPRAYVPVQCRAVIEFGPRVATPSDTSKDLR